MNEFAYLLRLRSYIDADHCEGTFGIYTANSIKIVFPEAETVNYEHASDDGLLLI